MATRLQVLHRRSYATLSSLNAVARTKAEALSAHWKGTSATGGNTRNFIGGEFVDSSTTEWHHVLDPVRSTLLHFLTTYSPSSAQATQTLLSHVPDTTLSEFGQAIDAASQAYKSWSRTSLLTRQRFVIEYATSMSSSVTSHTFRRLQHLIRKNADALADSIVLEQGKTLAGMLPSGF